MIIEQSRRESPREACGMIGGHKQTATHVYQTENSDTSEITYKIDPSETFNVIRKMRSDQVDFIASYHSHPATEAYPSPTDIREAGDLELIYVICSLRDKNVPRIRAFKIAESRSVQELQVQIGGVLSR
ncbi:MAG: M67 family metallopeptidase [Actinomycetia bacterium]|nr:M67 family metallopeptidase [Actinomycetes bacterium]